MCVFRQQSSTCVHLQRHMCCGVPYVNLLVCEFVNSYEALRDCEPVVNHRVNYFSPLDWPSINISLRGGCLMAVVKVKVGKHIKVLKWKQECVVSVGEERERFMCGSVVWTTVDSLSFTAVLSFSDTNVADFVLHFHHPLKKKNVYISLGLGGKIGVKSGEVPCIFTSLPQGELLL